MEYYTNICCKVNDCLHNVDGECVMMSIVEAPANSDSCELYINEDDEEVDEDY